MVMKRSAENKQAPEHGNAGDTADNLVLDVRAQQTILTVLPGYSLDQIAITQIMALLDHVILSVPFCGQKTLMQIRGEINRYLQKDER